MTTKIPVELSSTPSIVDNGDATAITIDSSERVGVGTTNPPSKLTVSGSDGGKGIELQVSTGSVQYLMAYDRSASDYIDMQIDAENLRFGTNTGVERMRIDSSGNVGIGITNPGEKFAVKGDASFIEITHPSASSFSGMKFSEGGVPQGSLQNIGSTFSTVARRGNFEIFHNTGGNLTFQHGGGNVGIGTSSPASNLHISTTGEARLIVEGDTNNDGGEESALVEFRTDSANVRHKVEAIGAGANDLRISAGSANSATALNCQIRFETKVAGSATAERARIDASGNFMVGQTSLNYNVAGSSMGSGGLFRACVEGGLVAALNRRASDGVILNFYKNGVTVGSISTNGHSLPVSDRNFKKDISDLDLGLDLITKLKPSQFRFKVSDEDSPLIYGLIAQDLEESLEELGVEKNSAWLLRHEPKEDVNEADYSVDYTALIPILINSIQEQQAIIEDLQTQINEVKNGN